MSDSSPSPTRDSSAVSPAPRAAAPSPGTVCVLGLGLIGGSLLRRLDAAAPGTVFGWNRSAPTVDAACADGHDVSADLGATLQRARAQDALIVIGVPMPAVEPLLQQVAEAAPGAAVTDVVSVKGPVLEAVRRANAARGTAETAGLEAGAGLRYVGGHPMAGTAHTGWAATDPALFDGATWVLGLDDPDPQVWRRVAAMATVAGSRLVAMDAAAHDAAVARISHLPHVLAEALAIAGAAGGDAALALGAGSFRDGTRVAGTPPDLVRAICEPNAAALEAVLAETIAELERARDGLRTSGSLGTLVDRGHAGRGAFEASGQHSNAVRDEQHRSLAAVPLSIGADGWVDVARTAGEAGRAVAPFSA